MSVYSQAGKILGKGKLTVLNNQVSTANGTAMLQAAFANTDEMLWPGRYVSAQLAAGNHRNVVIVPASAVMVGPSSCYVFGADNTLKRVTVRLAARVGGISVIGKGVSAGQKVVATGQYRLANGIAAAIRKTMVPHQGTRGMAGAELAAAD